MTRILFRIESGARSEDASLRYPSFPFISSIFPPPSPHFKLNLACFYIYIYIANAVFVLHLMFAVFLSSTSFFSLSSLFLLLHKGNARRHKTRPTQKQQPRFFFFGFRCASPSFYTPPFLLVPFRTRISPSPHGHTERETSLNRTQGHLSFPLVRPILPFSSCPTVSSCRPSMSIRRRV